MASRSDKSQPHLNDVKRKFFLHHLIGKEREDNIHVSFYKESLPLEITCMYVLSVHMGAALLAFSYKDP